MYFTHSKSVGTVTGVTVDEVATGPTVETRTGETFVELKLTVGTIVTVGT